jgi:PAS domain S-box-containing protein
MTLPFTATTDTSPWLRYGVAAGSVLVALLLRLALGPVLGVEAPLLVFVMSVTLSAWYGGVGPGMLATGLSTVVGAFFFLPPFGSIIPATLADLVRLIIFVFEGSLISTLSGLLHTARLQTAARAQDLEVSEERFRLLVEGVRDYAIFMLDTGGYVATWNTGAAHIKGYSAVEIVGKHFSLFYPPEDVQQGKPAAGLKYAATNGSYEDEGLRVRKDGSRFYASVLITALYDGNRQLRGFSKVVRDITERVEAEAERSRLLDEAGQARARAEAATATLERLQYITDAALAHLGLDDLLSELLQRIWTALDVDSVAILILDETGEALVTRAALGLEEEVTQGIRVPLGRGFAGRIAAERRPIVLTNIREADIASPVLRAAGMHALLGVPLLIEGRVMGVLHAGTRRQREFSDAEIQLLQRVADRAALAIEHARLYEEAQRHAAELEQRVAERTASLQTANSELRTANADLEAFSYIVSHDLRAPLRAIQGFGTALQEDYGDSLDSLGQQYTRRIVQAAHDLDRLIQDLLDYSRLSRIELRMQPLNLQVILAEALSQLAEEIRTRNADVSIAEPLPAVFGHATTLVQVLVNLLSNAIKFVVPEVQPRVRIWAEAKGPFARLWVEDNGISIASQYQEKVFRAFERLHGAESYAGTGIGLAIVRRGIERMGGQAGVESVEGQGSRFWIELPSVEDEV